jgi:excisionase family DNA binding protein
MPDQSLAERIAALIEAEKPTPPPEPPEPPALAYTVKEAARVTGLGVSTINREVRAGRLHKIRVRSRVLITDDELRRFLKQAAEPISYTRTPPPRPAQLRQERPPRR